MGRNLPPARPSLRHEKVLRTAGHTVIAGVDEVGRGSWAGPVVAAAVVLPLDSPRLLRRLAGVRDSKLLNHEHRDQLAAEIRNVALAVGIGWSTRSTIDELGIGGANRLALLRAVERLKLQPDALLIDYFALPECPLPQSSLVRGDACSLSIAAASIVAKVTRDRVMTCFNSRYPQYSFHRNKGYGTAEHRAALHQEGPCLLHRRSFRPVQECRA